MSKEAKSRIKINKLLEASGWRFFDDETGKANIQLEANVKLSQKHIDALGEDFEKSKNGFVDFLLLDEKGFPLVVLEAKREEKEPLDGKEQARRYAQSLNVRFVILSNGNLNYFWDIESGNPTIITAFPTQDSLKHFSTFKPDRKRLVEERVEEDYIVQTQFPTYKNDPRWKNENEQPALIEERGLKFLRHYQQKAVFALQRSAKDNCDRFLFEMATGTGKTLVSAAVIKLFLKTGNARRVLFLVDRLELEDQAWKSFVRYLKNDYTSVIYKENKDDWRKAEIVVSTVQSLTFDNKYLKLFSPTDFELVISDEAHRSISGNSRALFEYFIGFKLGLTATPKDYLKNIDTDELRENDVRAWERRQLLDTYKTFGCESGNPTFRYSLIDGVRDKVLVNPIVCDARTEITTELLAEEGYAVMSKNDDGEDEEQIFYHTDFEKKFFSEKTNLIFCKTFIENALKDPINGEIGKSIIFCVSQSHASKITQILNEIAMKLWSDKYNSDFAVQVTSNVQNAQQFTVNFANNNLCGNTRWLDGYKSSKARVCVTVGMMTTGYDCQDILNLCMLRPIFSPTDFVQIKGRGTRVFTFIHKRRDNGQDLSVSTAKSAFKLFDFFANCEYFEEKFNYDEVINLPREETGYKPGPIPPEPPTVREEFISGIDDPLKSLRETAVGPDGMRVDRELYEKFEKDIKNDPFIQEHFEKGNFAAIEMYIRTKIFDKPTEFYNLDKLRQSVKLDRRLTLREIVEKIFGRITRFKSKEELLDEEFEKFVNVTKPQDSDPIIPIKHYFKAYITDNDIRDIIEKKEYGRLATNAILSLSDFKALKEWRDRVPEYVKDYVPLNKYM